jgi:hypothetical protein
MTLLFPTTPGAVQGVHGLVGEADSVNRLPAVKRSAASASLELGYGKPFHLTWRQVEFFRRRLFGSWQVRCVYGAEEIAFLADERDRPGAAGLGGLGIRQPYPIARIREQVGSPQSSGSKWPQP